MSTKTEQKAEALLKAEAMISDNTRAQELGMSYGQYKAGVAASHGIAGEYNANTNTYITKTEPPMNTTKTKAFIKVKVRG